MKRKRRQGRTVSSICAAGLQLPEVKNHPNRLPFEGVLTLVGVASDKVPNGARGHRVILTRAAAKAALPSLIGMAVDYRFGWDGHDSRQKCGIITAARIVGAELRVKGFLYARDFPEFLTPDFADIELGMSYEISKARVADMRESVSIWVLFQVMFSGASILLRSHAAYRGTSFRVVTDGGDTGGDGAARARRCNGGGWRGGDAKGAGGAVA